jgi:hypothetical protein
MIMRAEAVPSRVQVSPTVMLQSAGGLRHGGLTLERRCGMSTTTVDSLIADKQATPSDDPISAFPLFGKEISWH